MALLPAVYGIPVLLLIPLVRRNYMKAFMHYEAIGQE
jgi:hypothetical protein